MLPPINNWVYKREPRIWCLINKYAIQRITPPNIKTVILCGERLIENISIIKKKHPDKDQTKWIIDILIQQIKETHRYARHKMLFEERLGGEERRLMHLVWRDQWIQCLVKILPVTRIAVNLPTTLVDPKISSQDKCRPETSFMVVSAVIKIRHDIKIHL